MKLKVLYISTRFPFYAKSGREKIILQSIDFLSECFDIFFAFFKSNRDFKVSNLNNEYNKKYNIKKFYELQFPNISEIIRNFIGRRHTSLQERLFFSKKNEIMIKQIIEKEKIDVVICDMIRTGQYVEQLPIRKIIDIDDLLSLRYKRYREVEFRESHLLGTFQGIIPNFFSKIIDKFLKNKVLKYEEKLIKEREIYFATHFDAVFLVSHREAAILQHTTGKDNIHTNPPAIKLHSNLYNPNIKENNLLFIGNMLTTQNLSSIEYIIKKIFPILEDIEFSLIIVGEYDKRLLDAVKNVREKVKVLGFVENLESVIKISKVLFSPIVFGTGIKTKILEAMSYGLPVVTNSIGVEGLDVKNYMHCIFEDDDHLVAEALRKILRNKRLREFISEEGYKYVKENYEYNKIKDEFLRVVKEVLSI